MSANAKISSSFAQFLCLGPNAALSRTFSKPVNSGLKPLPIRVVLYPAVYLNSSLGRRKCSTDQLQHRALFEQYVQSPQEFGLLEGRLTSCKARIPYS